MAQARRVRSHREAPDAGRRSGKGVGTRQVHLRHQPPRDAARAHPAVAARARAGRVDRSLGRAEGARREGGAGRARARQEGDVPGRRGRGGGGGDRGAGPRRAAPHQGGVRGAAPRRHRGACAAVGCTGRLRGRQHQGRRGRGERRSRGRLQVSRAHRGGLVRNAGADARVSRDEGLRLRVGGRQAHRVDFDSGRARQPRRIRGSAADSAGKRPHRLRVHGRRLRQQVRAGCAGRHLREAREAGGRAGEADARSQGGAPRRRQSPVVDLEDQGGRRG